MASDVMAVRLHLPQIRVLEMIEDTVTRLVVGAESTMHRLRCPNCGFKCHRVHDHRRKKITDLEVSGRRTTLAWSRRMVCGSYDSRFLEDHPGFEGGLTARLARALVADAKVMTLRAAGPPTRCGLAQDQRAGAGLGAHRSPTTPLRLAPPNGVGRCRTFRELTHTMPTSTAPATRWARPTSAVHT